MGFLITGLILLVSLFALFHYKNKLRKPWLAQLAYSDFTPRMMVVALGLIFLGLVLTIGRLFD